MPFALREEVDSQLRDMQQKGVIQPSSSLWASPVVMVHKKDCSHRFCVGYRLLNSVTKQDLNPSLGLMTYSISWANPSISVSWIWHLGTGRSKNSIDAFVTSQGLFEFQVMPFTQKLN